MCRRAGRGFAARGKTLRRCHPPDEGPAAGAAGPCAPGRAMPIEAAAGRGPEQPTRRSTMAVIGTFTRSDTGYTGSIRTLTLNVKVRISPAERDNDRAPDFRVFAGIAELGAAWPRTARGPGRE